MLKVVIGVVHAVSYSLLLLNTDLHVADLTTRMSRSQFVRNTLAAIQTQLQPARLTDISASDITYDDCSSIRGGGSDGTETISRSKRSNSITSWNSISRETIMSSSGTSVVTTPATQFSSPGRRPSDGSIASTQIPSGFEGASNMIYGRSWENDMENLLKVSCTRFTADCCLKYLNYRTCTTQSRASKSCSHSAVRMRLDRRCRL